MAAALATAVRFAADVPADLSEMAAARDALAEALADCGWSAEDTFRVLICADEAMANALVHGSGPTGVVGVRFRVDANAAALAIGDEHGAGETISVTPELPDMSEEHGRGLILMRALADAFRVHRHPGGTTVGLVFRAAMGGAS
jgi:anti-sigma regulatory factor (Ser/Thr protein kinase)